MDRPQEFLIRADGGNDWELIVRDPEALVPADLTWSVSAEEPFLTVRRGEWSAFYSPEDPGWQLSFDSDTPAAVAQEYVEAVARQLSAWTGVATRIVDL